MCVRNAVVTRYGAEGEGEGDFSDFSLGANCLWRDLEHFSRVNLVQSSSHSQLTRAFTRPVNDVLSIYYAYDISCISL